MRAASGEQSWTGPAEKMPASDLRLSSGTPRKYLFATDMIKTIKTAFITIHGGNKVDVHVQSIIQNSF
jgi:hypothetical protein